MKHSEKLWKKSKEEDNSVAKKAPDAETFHGYGLAGTIARRCQRIFTDTSELMLRYTGREISKEERRQIIEDFVRHIKERIVMFIDRDVLPQDLESENSSAIVELDRVDHKKTFTGNFALTVVFDDGSAFTYSDNGYDAYLPNTFNVSSPQAVH